VYGGAHSSRSAGQVHITTVSISCKHTKSTLMPIPPPADWGGPATASFGAVQYCLTGACAGALGFVCSIPQAAFPALDEYMPEAPC
jgi:hypothetical protein